MQATKDFGRTWGGHERTRLIWVARFVSNGGVPTADAATANNDLRLTTAERGSTASFSYPKESANAAPHLRRAAKTARAHSANHLC